MSRVTEIRYVGYSVKDLEAEKTWYGPMWGLEEVPSDDGMAWFKAQGHDEHHVVRLAQGDENRVDVIALAADTRADVDALHDKVAASGVQAGGHLAVARLSPAAPAEGARQTA